jgi:hypothetical protein
MAMEGIVQVWMPVVETGSFPIDTTLQLTGTFIASLTGIPTDPTNIALFMTPPGGPQTVITTSSGIVRVSAGVYSYTFIPSASGLWQGTWQGTGFIAATRDFAFNVQSSINIPG